MSKLSIIQLRMLCPEVIFIHDTDMLNFSRECFLKPENQYINLQVEIQLGVLLNSSLMYKLAKKSNYMTLSQGG